MEREQMIKKTEDHVRALIEGEGSGHDWWHIARVKRLAETIAAEEGADLFVVRLGALLHDIADWKFHGGDLTAGPRAARAWLEGLGVDASSVDHVCEIVEHISYKGAGVATPMATKEGMCVQDADRLEALGAIGIARAFAYGGHKNRSMYDPALSPEPHASFEQYKNSRGTTVNHFYEKLLLLKDRMNTAAGRRIAEGRHAYMENFLAEFYKEWHAEDSRTG
jgi:uncharacterized protein